MKKRKEEKSLRFFGIPKLIPYMKRHRKRFACMLVFAFFVSIVDILLPVFQKYALDHFIGESTMDTVLWFVLVYVGVLTVSAFMNYISSYFSWKTEVEVDKDLRNLAFDHLQTLSFSYYNQNSVGYIHSRVISDVSRIGELVGWTAIDITWRITYLVGAFVVMFSVNAKLALLVLAIIPLVMILFSVFQKKLIHVNREIREANAAITGDFNEGITGAKTIKTLGIEHKMIGSFLGDTAKIKRKTVHAAHLRGLFTGTISLATALALAIILWQGGAVATDEIGTFALFIAYAQGMMEPLRWLVESLSDIVTTQVNIERFTKLMETESDVSDTPAVIQKYGDTFHPKKENWEPIRGDIAFENVTFRYPDGEEYVLTDFNLQIPFGMNLAIVGETGAGKSTLVNLICRFFEPTKGKILIDGRDARERSQLWLHSSIGYVLQTPHLFSGTIRDNMLYGKTDATDDEIWAALRTVYADGFVNRMEKKLDSDVGEGGDLLSAGEKQLISFARAVLADPKILILDEATASVDTVTEQKIQAAIHKVIAGRTSVVIAHRLSTVRNVDMILVVKNGKIVEQGRHSELMQMGGYYNTLYTKQFEDEATATVLE